MEMTFPLNPDRRIELFGQSGAVGLLGLLEQDFVGLWLFELLSFALVDDF